MPPTGRSIDVEKVRRKLQEARSFEEKRLIVESVRRYVDFLEKKLERVENEVKSRLNALYVTVPLTFTSLVVTALAYVHELVLLLLALRLIVTLFTVIVIALTVQVCINNRKRQIIEKEIFEIYDILLDPAMKPDRRLDVTIIAIVLAALAIIATIIAWTWF